MFGSYRHIQIRGYITEYATVVFRTWSLALNSNQEHSTVIVIHCPITETRYIHYVYAESTVPLLLRTLSPSHAPMYLRE